MRRRVVREVGTVAGVAVLLLGLAFTNGALRRGSLAERMIAWRERLEQEQLQKNKDLELLRWPLLQETTGGYRSGPTFADDLKPLNGTHVNLMGFQVPVEQFRDMTEFLLLPMPIECYFCQRPPMKDVVLVQMAEGEVAPLVKEPVIINGILNLHEGPKTSFFYTITEAKWGPATEKVTRRKVDIQHQMEGKQQPEEPLLEGTAVPQAESVEEIIENAGAPLVPPVPDGAVAPEAATADPAAADPASAGPVSAPEAAPVPQ
mgnify:CR=1 FL=1